MNINVQMNPGFKEVDRNRKRYIVMKGSAGSGKSVDTAQNYILRLMQDPGRNLLCVRKADVTNRDSTFAELQGAIFRMFGEQYKRYWHINSSNMIMECKINRNQIIFRGVNDEKQREKLKSITFKRGKLTDVWIEEATEITQADFEIIDDRLRGELPGDRRVEGGSGRARRAPPGRADHRRAQPERDGLSVCFLTGQIRMF